MKVRRFTRPVEVTVMQEGTPVFWGRNFTDVRGVGVGGFITFRLGRTIIVVLGGNRVKSRCDLDAYLF